MPIVLSVISLAVFGSWFWLFPDTGLTWFRFVTWAVLSFGSAAIGLVYSPHLIGQQSSSLAIAIVAVGILLCFSTGVWVAFWIRFVLTAGG